MYAVEHFLPIGRKKIVVHHLTSFRLRLVRQVVQEQENRGIMYTYTIPTASDSASASHHQRTRHRHHGVRHHQQRSGHPGAQHYESTTAPTADGPAEAEIDPAERPVNDAGVEPGIDYGGGGGASEFAVDDHGRQQQKVDNNKQVTS